MLQITLTGKLTKTCSKKHCLSVSHNCFPGTGVPLQPLGTLHGPGVTSVFLTGELLSSWEVPSLVSLGSSMCLSPWCLFSVRTSCASALLFFSMDSNGILERLEVLNLLEPTSLELDLVNKSSSEAFLLESLKRRLSPPNTR